MKARALLVATVVLMATLAGCGLGGDGTTTTAAGDTTTTTTATTTTADDGTTTADDGTTTTDETTTTTTTATTTTTSDGGGGGGDLPADVGQRHRQALESAGSFTVVQQLAYRNETTTFISSDITSWLDLNADRGYQNGSTGFGGFSSIQSTYTDGDTTWQRQNSSFGQSYSKGTAPYGPDEPTPINFTTVLGQGVNTTTSNVTFSEAGSVTIDGVQATRYEASGQQLIDELGVGVGNGSFFGNATVESASAAVAVDGEGVIRLLTFEIVLSSPEAGQVTLGFEQRVTDVGSTTVSEPDWLDEAREQAGGSNQ